jgi:hypothetical protein
VIGYTQELASDIRRLAQQRLLWACSQNALESAGIFSILLSRSALNIPARYVTGYLGDIGVPPAPSPMTSTPGFEVYLENRWWTFDARHNQQRVGRVLMATGRDASDVAITITIPFGIANLIQFTMISEELSADQATSVGRGFARGSSFAQRKVSIVLDMHVQREQHHRAVSPIGARLPLRSPSASSLRAKLNIER